MTRQDILEIAHKREDNFAELKPPSVNRADIRQTLCAFANSLPSGRVGRLLIGVGDDGRLMGCENPDEIQKRVRDAGQDCYPPIAAVCEVLLCEGQRIVVVTVGPSDQRPHFSGPAYVRQGSESVKSSAVLLDELIASRNTKAGALFRLKGQVVTVVGLGHKLGSLRRDLAPGYTEKYECKVIACDAHRVELQFLASQAFFNEAVDRIEFGHDYDRNRPQLNITGR